MSVHHRKLKQIEFSIDETQFECQVQQWSLDPGIGDGERNYAFCPDGEFIDDPEPEPTLELTFYADWRSDGISAFLWEHKGEEAEFVLDHHPDIPAEHVRWTGRVRLRPGPVGGEPRTTELTEVTLEIVGEPKFERVDGSDGESDPSS